LTNQVSHTFRKEEKLCSLKLMGDIFLSGNSFLCYPLKVVWKKQDTLPSESPAQVAFSVPKRQFKHAVDRNHLKRLLRETYRLQKSELYDILVQTNTRIALSIIYIAKEELPYAKIYPAITKIISKLKSLLMESRHSGLDPESPD
jgi:ribonuclease P protein component